MALSGRRGAPALHLAGTIRPAERPARRPLFCLDLKDFPVRAPSMGPYLHLGGVVMPARVLLAVETGL